MAKAAKPDHKSAFAALHAGLAPSFRDAGLHAHPVWQPGWDKHNAHYAADYLAPPAPDGIRSVTLIYAPGYKGWYVTGSLYPCPDAAERLASARPDTTWITCLDGLPHRQSDLAPWKKRLFWRAWVRRELRFDAQGHPRDMVGAIAAARNGWPAFWASLSRPGTA